MKTEFYGMTTIGGYPAIMHLMGGEESYPSLGNIKKLSTYCPVCDIDYEVYATHSVDVSKSWHCPHCSTHLNFMEIIK